MILCNEIQNSELNTMKGTNRLATIRQLLLNDKKVLVSDLSQKFSVTEETIRRDLEKLEAENFATRTYGGAVFNGEEIVSNIPFYKRAEKNFEQKQNIAIKTVQLLKNRSTISADSSSTVMETLKLLKDRNDLTIVTNSTEALRELMLSSVNILSTGGMFNKQSLSLQGTLAEQSICNYNVDTAVISCKGLDIATGITDSNEDEAKLKMRMISQATEVILLADSSKFNKKAFVHLTNLSNITTIITDKEPSKEWITYLKTNQIQLIY